MSAHNRRTRVATIVVNNTSDNAGGGLQSVVVVVEPLVAVCAIIAVTDI
ncbi:MAG: hypothetical protein ACYDBJ_02670 [Aggregatilineales bacterium]